MKKLLMVVLSVVMAMSGTAMGIYADEAPETEADAAENVTAAQDEDTDDLTVLYSEFAGFIENDVYLFNLYKSENNDDGKKMYYITYDTKDEAACENVIRMLVSGQIGHSFIEKYVPFKPLESFTYDKATMGMSSAENAKWIAENVFNIDGAIFDRYQEKCEANGTYKDGTFYSGMFGFGDGCGKVYITDIKRKEGNVFTACGICAGYMGGKAFCTEIEVRREDDSYYMSLLSIEPVEFADLPISDYARSLGTFVRICKTENGNTPLYADPDKGSSSYRNIREGAAVLVDMTENGMGHIVYEESAGWIDLKYAQPVNNSAVEKK